MTPFLKDISQSKLIPSGNKLLKKHQIPLELNSTGICNGLVYLALEYFLNNQIDKFFYDIQLFIELKNYDEALLLVTQIYCYYTPHNLFFDYSQLQSHNLFKTPSKPTFTFGAVMPSENWRCFFHDFDLKENEMMLVSSPNHIVYLTRRGSHYVVYDPNESEGEIIFESIYALVNNLKDVFHFDQYLGLTIQVFQKNGSTNNSRNKETFYQMVDANSIIKLNDVIYDTLHLSVQLNDVDALHYFNSKINIGTLKTAIYFKADSIVKELLTEKYRNILSLTDSLMEDMIYFSLMFGSYKIFNIFLEDNKFNEIMTNNLLKNKAVFLLDRAIYGKNSEIFRQILDMCASQKSFISNLSGNRGFKGHNEATKLLLAALKTKNTEITKKLIDFYKVHEISLNIFEKECLIIAAIQTNDLTSLQYVIDFANPGTLQLLKLDIFTVYETHSRLINTLKEYGVILTFWQEFCLQHKDNGFLSVLIYIAMFFMNLYRCNSHLSNPAMKTIYFEQVPDDPVIETTYLLETVQSSQEKANSLFKRSNNAKSSAVEDQAPVLANTQVI